MAKLVLTLLAIFLLFSLSRSQSDPNHRDDLLLLPSDNPRSALPDDSVSSVAVADPKPAIEDPQPNRDAFVTLPLTKLDFHEGSNPLSLRFPHRLHFGRGCRQGRHGMHPRQISYGNDMILSDGKDASQEFHWVNRRPGFEVSVPWKGGEESLFQRPEELEHGRVEEDEEMFKRPMKFKHGHHLHHDDDDDEDDEIFKRPKKFRHHDDDEDDAFKRPKKFDHDDEFSVLETVSKVKHDYDGHVFRMPRKFKHHDDDHEDWHREGKHHHRRFGRHHHKHHHDDDDEDDNKGGIFSEMRKFFDDLF
ncbi:hypothetical protein MLD38_016649 [Melastoma candidum]|uniref:Uncharacterized protein n=2 Tax=Melastoma candidum TaxID=119954 RepID=A0ACB9QN80_9MYRT|nr:hypothetical protein MLD38_016649 [Melastoma candidum]